MVTECARKKAFLPQVQPITLNHSSATSLAEVVPALLRYPFRSSSAETQEPLGRAWWREFGEMGPIFDVIDVIIDTDDQHTYETAVKSFI